MPGTAGRTSHELLNIILTSASVKIFVVVYLLSWVQLFWDPWTVARQVPLSMGFFRQEHQSGLPLPSPGDLPDPEMEPTFPALPDGFFTAESPGYPKWRY